VDGFAQIKIYAAKPQAIPKGHLAVTLDATFFEKGFAGVLILCMGATVLQGILKFKRMQMDYDLRCPAKAEK
jgi:hypothetical protein